jgi:glycosyltransferase involved in cell wall biosynthesis
MSAATPPVEPVKAAPAAGQPQGITLSLIVTALNEEDNIAPTLRNSLAAFDHYGVNGEIVFINDGSRDRTGQIFAEAFSAHPNIRLITHDAPHGVGASFWEGVDQAAGDVVGWIPGDNEVDAWELLRYFPLLQHVDIVIPFTFNTMARSWIRRTLSSVYRFIINTTFRTNFNYTNGPILYRRSILAKLTHRSSSFFFQTDALIRLVSAGYMFAEVPFILNQRDKGASKAVSLSSLALVVRGYLRLVQDIYFHAPVPRNFTSDTQTSKRAPLP